MPIAWFVAHTQSFVGSLDYPIVITVGVLTMAYTAYGGTYVSILTDQLQAWFTMAFLATLSIYVAVNFRCAARGMPCVRLACRCGGSYKSLVFASALDLCCNVHGILVRDISDFGESRLLVVSCDLQPPPLSTPTHTPTHTQTHTYAVSCYLQPPPLPPPPPTHTCSELLPTAASPLPTHTHTYDAVSRYLSPSLRSWV